MELNLQDLSKKEQQEILDNHFPQDRREAMLKTASEDASGRKVRYYRRMSMQMLVTLLNNGKLSVADYIRESEFPTQDFIGFLRNYLARVMPDERLDTSTPLITLMRLAFTGLPEAELTEFTSSPNMQTAIELIDRHLDKEAVMAIHKGSLYQKFSSYLSLSVGGMISLLSPDLTDVYVEFIIPSNLILVSQLPSVEGEKEVFIKEISAEHISRVWVDANAQYNFVMNSPESPASKYDEGPQRNVTKIDQWRWGELTASYLPTELLN